MAGFEVIVRPVVFPNIRPAPARSLAPEDDPEQGIAVLSGSSGKLIDLSRTDSGSWTRSKKREVKRTVQNVRVFQKEDDGTINRDNFIDTKRIKKFKERDAHEDTESHYAPPPLQDNEEFLDPKQTTHYASDSPDTPWGTDLSPQYPEVDDDERLPNIG